MNEETHAYGHRYVYVHSQINLFDLLFHSLDFVLPGFHLSPQLLNLVVQHKFKLLQLLILLFKVIDTFLLEKIHYYYAQNNYCDKY